VENIPTMPIMHGNVGLYGAGFGRGRDGSTHKWGKIRDGAGFWGRDATFHNIRPKNGAGTGWLADSHNVGVCAGIGDKTPLDGKWRETTGNVGKRAFGLIPK
jgi:hypothetical protein